jgi:predicted ribosomally synthesized peptide with SipW-like signal peptide
MRNVFLTVVVICALLVAAVGGTLAGFSDTESSVENVFEVGNMDLKVSVPWDGPEYDDPNVPPIVNALLVWPCTSQNFTFDLHNYGDNPQDCYAYVCFKNFNCYEVTDVEYPATKHPDGRPEPEVVAEEGGMLANVELPAMGPFGQNCTLADFVEIVLEYDIDGDGDLDLVLGNPIWGAEGTVYLSDLWSGVQHECLWIPLDTLSGCEKRYGKISLHISNIAEEDWDPPLRDRFENDKPFNDWLTNLFMSDGVEFEMCFALTQDPIPADQVYNGD